MVTRPNLNSCTKPTFISCRSVLLPDFHWHSLKLNILQLHWFRSSYKHPHQPSKVTKVATEDKAKEFITLYFLKFMRVSEEIKNKKQKKLRITMSWSGLLGVKYNHMLKVKGNLVYDFTQKIEIKLLKSATNCNRAKFPSYAYELETPWLVSYSYEGTYSTIQVRCSLTLKTVLPHQAIYILQYKSLADQSCL